jgi:hypothetical protein
MDKRLLFVSGVARSGTTVLGELLNAHPAICLGIERFKFRFLVERSYAPEYFTKERFFTFLEEDTNLRPEVSRTWRLLYQKLEQKWDGAQVVGDKTPDMTPIMGELLRRYPGCSFLYILRDIAPVAASWQARAENPKDINWPETKGYAAAIDSWTRQNEVMLRHMQHPHFAQHVRLIEYDRFFFEPCPGAAEGLETFLGLPHVAAFADKLASLIAANADRVSDPMKRLPPAGVSAVAEADRGAYQQLLGLAQAQLESA